MTRYILSTGADGDLDEIWDYIAQDNADAADRWIDKLFDAFELLARTPGIGHARKDLTHFPVFFWPVGAYLVIYRQQRGCIEIIAVTQGARNIPTFLHRRAKS